VPRQGKLLIHARGGIDSRYGLIRQLSDIEKTELNRQKEKEPTKMNPTQEMIKRLFLSITISVAISVATLIAGTSSAAAQSEACIYLVPGSTISTQIRVLAEDIELPLDVCCPASPGTTQCISLDPVPDGTQFLVLALLPGNAVECGGDFNNLTRSASLQTSITFYASGTYLAPHCTAPSSALKFNPKPSNPKPK
jgi:hypothetical protein